MNNIRENIDKIIEKGLYDDIVELTDILENCLTVLKRVEPKCYEKYAILIYTIANGHHFTEEIAKHIVENMVPLSEVWSLDTVKSIVKDRGYKFNPIDFYIVLNSVKNDYKNLDLSDDLYIRMAADFIDDKDAIEYKVFQYFTTLVK